MSIIAKPPMRSLGTLIGGASYGRAFRRIEPALDADAAKYLAAVEAADKQVLEDGVKRAVSAFVRACKADGNWDAIKASCILCGARTLAGALVPLKGAAPTNYNFVGLGTDYSRTAGLTGDGSAKYLDSGRNAYDSDEQNNHHVSVFPTNLPGETQQVSNIGALIAARENATAAGSIQIMNVGPGNASPNSFTFISAFTSNLVNVSKTANALAVLSRSGSTSFSYRAGGSTGTQSDTSSTLADANYTIFNRSPGSASAIPSAATIAFYSIGEAVDLAALDTSVSTMISEIGAAV